MKHPTFPDAQKVFALNMPCERCRAPIQGTGHETQISDGREPVLALYCRPCLDALREAAGAKEEKSE